MSINVPIRLKRKLEAEDEWNAVVINLISNTKNYFENLPMVFFPEYTVHGTRHINNVLKIVDKLIPDDTIDTLTSRDTAILICSVIVHDIGMFIQPDGANAVLFGSYKTYKTNELDRLPWDQLWKIYSDEIMRYSDEKIYSTFGINGNIRIPPENFDELLPDDYRIYGEFFRRHHHRLAHEIVNNGFYGSSNYDIFQNIPIRGEVKDLIGLIARSHGMAIRDTFSYMLSKFADTKMPYNVPVVYLMCLLRLADYLDAGDNRAPQELLEARRIKSPISKREWNWNSTIDLDAYVWNNPPESLRIHSSPKDNLTYLVVKKWLEGVQYELDMCWAAICESCYDYKLAIHRVTSNITSPETIATFDFSTKEAKLTANTELLKLLIHPLYGDSSSYGVRELLQNAVDACLERAAVERNRGNAYTPSVNLWVDESNSKFIIEDNGTGMDENIIINYFLTAGSSYRYSDEWIKMFTSDNRSTVRRTGKFGIGVLAAFLIGDEINVETRHINDARGYSFQLSFDKKNINLMKCTKKDCGTKITVNINHNKLEEFSDFIPFFINRYNFSSSNWTNWYHFRTPNISYYYNGNLLLEKTSFVPGENDNYMGWYHLSSDHFTSYQWQFNKRLYRHQQFCNGIMIEECVENLIGEEYGYEVYTPSLSLVDKENYLKIDLSRRKILEIPEKERLLRDIYKYIIAKLLSIDWSNNTIINKNFETDFENVFKSFLTHNETMRTTSVLTCKKGYTLFHPSYLSDNKIKDVALVVQHNSSVNNDLVFNSQLPTVIAFSKHENQHNHFSLIDDNNLLTPLMNEYSFKTQIVSLVRSKETYAKSKNLLITKSRKRRETIEKDYVYNKLMTTRLSLNPDFYDWDNTDMVIHYRMHCINKIDHNLMMEMIHEYLNDNIWIPFDMEERKKKYPKAFKELAKYMENDRGE